TVSRSARITASARRASPPAAPRLTAESNTPNHNPTPKLFLRISQRLRNSFRPTPKTVYSKSGCSLSYRRVFYNFENLGPLARSRQSPKIAADCADYADGSLDTRKTSRATVKHCYPTA